MLVKRIFSRGEDSSNCNFEIECEWEPRLLSELANDKAFAWSTQLNDNESPPTEGSVLSTPDFQNLRVVKCTIEEDFFEDTIFLSTQLVTSDPSEILRSKPNTLTRQYTSYEYGLFNMQIKDPTKVFTILATPDQLIKK